MASVYSVLGVCDVCGVCVVCVVCSVCLVCVECVVFGVFVVCVGCVSCVRVTRLGPGPNLIWAQGQISYSKNQMGSKDSLSWGPNPVCTLQHSPARRVRSSNPTLDIIHKSLH